jgi:hypothetical protein
VQAAGIGRLGRYEMRRPESLFDIAPGTMLDTGTLDVLRPDHPKSARQEAAAQAANVQDDTVERSGWLSVDWGAIVEGIDEARIKIWAEIDRYDARNARRDQSRIAFRRLGEGTDYMPYILGGGLIALALVVRKSRS